jgi:hypothetical protein
MKIAVGMIVFEGDYVLKQCLEQLYPHVDQILISEGPVTFWQQRGKTTSEDSTNEILSGFPDPEDKIKVVHGQFKEKDDQSNAYMNLINEDTDYLWMVDSDETYRTQDILKLKQFLLEEQPTSVGMQSCSFFGGFDHYLTGFELNTDNFLRIFKYVHGAKWLRHRPPTMDYPSGITKKHISSLELFQRTGVQMYHYSYTFPRQVYTKTSYYSTFVQGGTIPDYFRKIYLGWVRGNSVQRKMIETLHKGVHEWIPQRRGPCFTTRFLGQHPESIQRDMVLLQNKFKEQLSKY